jgi:hypothetical protein
MRAFQVFAGMEPQQAERLQRALAEKAPAVSAQAVAVAAATMSARPQYLRKQPFEKQAAAVRRALSRVRSNDMAEEVLAVYFLECRKELLLEWLDLVGLAHEEGMLKEASPAAPPPAKLRAAVERFRAAGDEPDRELLLRAFAAQTSIEWPELDALLGASAA